MTSSAEGQMTLKPCPFHGISGEIKMYPGGDIAGSKLGPHVACDLCLTNLHDGKTKELAAERWNSAYCWKLLEAERAKTERLVEVVEKLVTQFYTMKMHQHDKLVRGQTLESASENWNELLDLPLEFEPVILALEDYRATEGTENGATT